METAAQWTCGCGHHAETPADLPAHFAHPSHVATIARAAPDLIGSTAKIVTGSAVFAWCPPCALQSRLLIPLYVLSASGPVRVGEAFTCLTLPNCVGG